MNHRHTLLCIAHPCFPCSSHGMAVNIELQAFWCFRLSDVACVIEVCMSHGLAMRSSHNKLTHDYDACRKLGRPNWRAIVVGTWASQCDVKAQQTLSIICVQHRCKILTCTQHICYVWCLGCRSGWGRHNSAENSNVGYDLPINNMTSECVGNLADKSMIVSFELCNTGPCPVLPAETAYRYFSMQDAYKDGWIVFGNHAGRPAMYNS